MGAWIAQECVKYLLRNGNGKTVVILGITFKEDVPDIRNSKAIDIVAELRSFGADVHIADPLADPAECQHEYGITPTALADLPPADAVILAVAHDEYKRGGWLLVADRLKPDGGLVMDIKAFLDRTRAPPNVRLWRM
jgi:UDP-N-acetyl-D-galactosamine dehydrogenase